MESTAIIKKISAIRDAIRYHRAQISDYRCWVDDERLYQVTLGSDLAAARVPATEEFKARCAAFWDLRQRPEEQGRGDPTVNSEVAPLKIATFSDEDLKTLSGAELARELERLENGVRKHLGKGDLGRVVRDDEQLYALLPERAEWSSALPAREVFLKNCERFCEHCQKNPGDLFEWSNREPL